MVSGKVVDQDGDPLEGFEVSVSRKMWMQGKPHYFPNGNANTDEEGQYRVAGLQPGRYYLSVQGPGGQEVRSIPTSSDKPDLRPVRTYYPDAQSRDTATPVSVSAGQTLTGMDVRVRFLAAHHVRGRFAGQAPPSNDRVQLIMNSEDSDFPFGFGLDSRNGLKPDRTFDIPGVTPGRYSISVMEFSGRPRVLAKTNIEVGDADVNGIELAPVPAGSLNGQIVLQGKPPGPPADIKQVRLSLQPEGQSFFFPTDVDMKENGTFLIRDVPPGKYRVRVYGLPQGTYTQSVLYGSQNVLHKDLDLNAGAGGELQVTVAYGVAELDGSVVLEDNRPDAMKKVKASVFLFPDDNPGGDQLFWTEPDQNAAFKLREIPPGKYRAIAAEGLTYSMVEDPDMAKELAALGTDVELKENDKRQIQLPVISSAEVRQIMARLGVESE